MVSLSANWVTAPTDNSALVAIDRSGGSGDILFNDIKSDDNLQAIPGVGQNITNPKQDLPRHEAGKDRRREGLGEAGVRGEEAPDRYPERFSSTTRSRSREGREIEKIG